LLAVIIVQATVEEAPNNEMNTNPKIASLMMVFIFSEYQCIGIITRRITGRRNMQRVGGPMCMRWLSEVFDKSVKPTE
jgi:hypothetical protein